VESREKALLYGEKGENKKLERFRLNPFGNGGKNLGSGWPVKVVSARGDQGRINGKTPAGEG